MRPYSEMSLSKRSKFLQSEYSQNTKSKPHSKKSYTFPVSELIPLLGKAFRYRVYDRILASPHKMLAKEPTFRWPQSKISNRKKATTEKTANNVRNSSVLFFSRKRTLAKRCKHTRKESRGDGQHFKNRSEIHTDRHTAIWERANNKTMERQKNTQV